MANKYYYKGTDINSIVKTGGSTIPTTTFNGFPPYTTSIQPYSKIDVDISYCESGQPITSKYPITGSVYNITANTDYAVQAYIPIPTWASNVKFIMSSTTGAVGAVGPKGPNGTPGNGGTPGNAGKARGCPMGNATRPRGGGGGGAGGVGGVGGPGGPGGPGGAGAFIFTSSPIPIDSQNYFLKYNIGKSNSTVLNINDNYLFTAYRGQIGGQGFSGNSGNNGTPGSPGQNGGNGCQDPGTAPGGAPGNPGTPGNTGAQGAAGNPANVVIPPIVGGTGNAYNTTSNIDVYFFKT